jgi:mannose-1-phosphate guanylyltransferase
MKLVLLCGGSGKRLWPLSNDPRSKPFLKILKSPEGGFESMVQRVWRQLSSVQLAQEVWITTGQSQVDIIHNQLGGVPLIVEPERRDTFPAIALAACYLHSEEGVGEKEVVGILPVDTYAADSFYQRVKDLKQVLLDTDAELALMGVPPSHPSEKYGYILLNQANINLNQQYWKVSHFIEKPDKNYAEKIIQKQALWNCGVLAFRLEYILSLLKEKGFPTEYKELIQVYGELPRRSIDVEVIEKAKNIVVIPYDGTWKDIGTWNTFTEEIENPLFGKGIISEDSTNTHLINELNIPIAVLGLSNTIVAASLDGILVADKTTSSKIKEFIRKEQDRPYYEERRWGWYRVLDYTRFENGTKALTKRVRVMAGKNLSYQIHNKRSEVWTIVSGQGELVLNEEFYLVKPGDVLKIPIQARHGVKAITDLEFIEVQTGSELTEEDIIRICMDWDEVMEFVSPIPLSSRN